MESEFFPPLPDEKYSFTCQDMYMSKFFQQQQIKPTQRKEDKTSLNSSESKQRSGVIIKDELKKILEAPTDSWEERKLTGNKTKRIKNDPLDPFTFRSKEGQFVNEDRSKAMREYYKHHKEGDDYFKDSMKNVIVSQNISGNSNEEVIVKTENLYQKQVETIDSLNKTSSNKLNQEADKEDELVPMAIRKKRKEK
jgi:hypothetical protein